MIALYDHIRSDHFFDGSFDGIGDWSEVQSTFTRDEVKALSDYVTTHQISTGDWVALVSEPFITAYATIYGQRVSIQHKLHICSTVERASELLKRNIRPFLLPGPSSTKQTQATP